MRRPTRCDLPPGVRGLGLVAAGLAASWAIGAGSAGCTPPSAAPRTAAARAPALPPPPAPAPGAPGADYLAGLARELQPRWAQFLEDCRLRLPPDHPLNDPARAAIARLVIDRAGRVVERSVVTSGGAELDRAVRDVLAEVSRLAAPPVELLSDDDRVHVRWLFARDRRQAGAATAELVRLELPLLEVTERLVAGGELARAARRVAQATEPAHDRAAAIERGIEWGIERAIAQVMNAALREAVVGPASAARPLAVEAIGRAEVRALAAEVRALLSPTSAPELRRAASAAVAGLGDQQAVPILFELLLQDLADGGAHGEPAAPGLVLAETAALIALGHRERVAAAIQRALETTRGRPGALALHAHALAPTPAVARRLASWFARGDAGTRAAVCAAVPAAELRSAVVLRGLRDPAASVRASCIAAIERAIERQGRARPPAPPTMRRLRALARDRDRRVRARAVAALAQLEPASVAQAATDPAPEVRAAAVAGLAEPVLRGLADDPAPEVRAAAVRALGAQAGVLAGRAATDPAPEVRLAAVAALEDDAALARLSTDDASDVATAALVRLVARRGRAAMASALLARLAAAPTGSAEHVRVAQAYLMAGPGLLGR